MVITYTISVDEACCCLAVPEVKLAFCELSYVLKTVNEVHTIPGTTGFRSTSWTARSEPSVHDSF